jgi:hypothetical protein
LLHILRTISVAVAFVLLTGCTVLRSLPFTEDTKRYQVARTYFERGNYATAYEAFKTIADSQSPWAEESKFNAAYVLIYHNNPRKNYMLAEKEFEIFLTRYPSSTLSGEATTWFDMLKMFQQTKAGELAHEVSLLTEKIENVMRELKKTQAEDVVLRKERDLLVSERTALAKKVDALLTEKEALIRKNTELAQDKEGLAKDKSILTKKVELLNREKSRLLEAKASLEKSLHDLTMVDVKMERQRTKLKKEDKK